MVKYHEALATDIPWVQELALTRTDLSEVALGELLNPHHLDFSLYPILLSPP